MSAKRLILARDGSTAYQIALSPEADDTERFAAEELRSHLLASLGVDLPYFTDGDRDREYLICIGEPTALRASDRPVYRSELQEEEISIRTCGGRIFLNGGSPRGALYAVYQFLEDYVGIRWFAPDCTRIPKHRELILPEIDYRFAPPFVFRNCYVWTALHDPLWAARNRLNSTTFSPSDALTPYGGCSGHSPAGHSFFAMVPPSVYFDEHPEYFSMIDGKRVSNGQLCLSNPEVFEIVLGKLKERLRANPRRIGADVAQNDWLGACQCENCRKIDEKYHAFSGSIITFCNKLADALREEFPDRLVQTYAYQYGQTAPENLKAADNVAVWICSIESCFCHPHGTCDQVRRELRSPGGRNPLFPRDLADWSRVADNLFVWNYDTNFRCFLLPHPNLHVLGPNLRFFRDNGVRGVFEQNCSSSPHTEMQELRAYILAKCLWNPDTDDRAALEEFTDAWFGMAAGPIRQYIDLLRDTVNDRSRDMHLLMSTMPPNPNNFDEHICSSITRSAYEKLVAEGKPLPTHGICKYMEGGNLEKANALFDRAERLADDETVLDRVRIARLSIRYYELTVMKNDAPDRQHRIDEFFADCSRYGVTQLKEAKDMETCYNALVNNLAMY